VARPARIDDAEFTDAYYANDGNIAATARDLGFSWAGAKYWVDKLGLTPPLFEGDILKEVPRKLDLPPEGQIYTYLFTCAQNNTVINRRLWKTLSTAQRYYVADIWVATINYNVGAYGKFAVKRGEAKTNDPDLGYAREVMPYLHDENVEIAPGLVWCGKLNLSLTKDNPLSGWDNYTQRKSGIFPHAKVALKSIPTIPGRRAKMNYSTGTCTGRNVIKKEAGQKHEFHHTYGALLVEVDHEGTWFARQLIADERGRIQDLDVIFDGDKVLERERVKAITWGDWHTPHLDESVANCGWRKGGCGDVMLDALRPEEQHVNDAYDGFPIGHWDYGKASERHYRYVNGKYILWEECELVADELTEAERPWCTTYVINSNHDRWPERWIDDPRALLDPPNLELWGACIARTAAARRRKAEGKDEKFLLVEWLTRRTGRCPASVVFLHEDVSHRLFDEIEILHGDRGANGMKGTFTGLSKLGDRVIMADKHTAHIIHGLTAVGCSCLIPLRYQKGQSSHSHTHAVTYQTSKRALITVIDGRWRLPR
jgi:hypothetical protein